MTGTNGVGRRSVWWAALVAPVVLVAAACDAGASAPSVAPTPVASSASAASATPAPTTASPTPSASPSSLARTSAELQKALLSLKDVPAGFEVDPSAQDDGGVSFSSTASGCSALVRLLRTTTLPGSVAQAGISFTGGNDGPEVSEDLDAMGTKQAAAAFIQSYRTSVRSCRTITINVPGAGSARMEVREISFAKLGDDTFAARMRVTSGPLKGLEAIQAGVASGDVVVGINAIGLEGPDVETATGDAVTKAARVLSTGTSI